MTTFSYFTRGESRPISGRNKNLEEFFCEKIQKQFLSREAYTSVNKEDAKKREGFFKTGWGRQFVKKNLKNYFLSKI